MAIPTTTLKKHQQKIFGAIIGALASLGAVLFFLGVEKAPPPKEQINDKAPLYDVTTALEDKSFWLFNSENRLAEQEKTQKKLMTDIENIQAALKKPEEDEAGGKIEVLQNRITELEKKLTPPSLEQDQDLNAENNPKPFVFGNNASQNLNGDLIPNPSSLPSIFSESLGLANPSTEKMRPHYDSYVPAGAYAKAVLLSGVDVSVGISSQTNPQPVLLRLVHKGSLPNKFVGKMRDCRIVAAASGELSSERAQFRLEKLSCIEPDGRVIETDVDGYISGEDGKNGMRGRLVMRDTEMLKRGFLGGLLSGLGKATSQSFNSTSVSPLGAVSTVKGADIFKQAGAEGAGSAFELMARYNIQRAEQYQPVIQISAGREVTVIFHSGRALGEHRDKPTKTPVPNHPSLFGENP